MSPDESENEGDGMNKTRDLTRWKRRMEESSLPGLTLNKIYKWFNDSTGTDVGIATSSNTTQTKFHKSLRNQCVNVCQKIK